MLYAIFGAYFLSVTVVLLVAVSFFWIKMRLDGFERGNMDVNTRSQALSGEFEAMKVRINGIEALPDAPAIEQYKAVLHDLENVAHQNRDLELRFSELKESITRTQNKLAAREPRDKKTEPAAPPALSDVPGAIPLSNEVQFPGAAEPRRRRFGQFR